MQKELSTNFQSELTVEFSLVTECIIVSNDQHSRVKITGGQGVRTSLLWKNRQT